MTESMEPITTPLEPLAVPIPEAARLLGISPHTIRAYIREGKIRHVRFGRRVLVPMSEVVRLSQEGAPSLSEKGTAHEIATEATQ